MTDPALTLCETLELPTRDRVGCARPSTRQPDRPCRDPDCKCGPSGGLLAIREALAAEREGAIIEAASVIRTEIERIHAVHSPHVFQFKSKPRFAVEVLEPLAAAILKLNEASNDQA